MPQKIDSKWMVIIGAIIALLSFLTPAVIYQADLGFGAGLKQGVSIADAAKDSAFIYLVPLCFLATAALSFMSSSAAGTVQSNQPMFRYGQWAASILGFIISLVVVMRLFNAPSQILDKASGLTEGLGGFLGGFDLGGMIQDMIKVKPGIGLFLLLIGFGLQLFGLISAPRGVTPSFSAGNYEVSGHPIQSYSADPNGDFNQAQDFHSPYPGSAGSDIYNEPITPVYREHARKTRPPNRQEVPLSADKPRNLVSAWLVSKEGKNYQLSVGTTTIGRSSANDIQLLNTKVSKQHAKIVEEHQQFKLYDLGSTNGTWINGKPVNKPVQLYSEDKIRFGDSFSVQFVSINPKR